MVAMNPRAALVVGLLTAAVGLVIIWAGDKDLPTVPPGVVIPVVAAGLAAAVKARWSAVIGVLAALFLVVGFFASGASSENLSGDLGATVVAGQVVQLAGLALAVVGGVVVVARRG
jgi:hypothetical protein